MGYTGCSLCAWFICICCLFVLGCLLVIALLLIGVFVMLFASCVVGLRLAWVLWIRFRLRDFRVVGLD